MKTRRAVVCFIGSTPCGIIKVCTSALLALFLASFLWVPTAQAAVWPVSECRLSPSLAFQDTYSVDAHIYKHYGIDVPSSAGAQINAPVSGRVSFVGRVPSGDSAVNGGGEGETMNAVSIKMSDGRTLTLMPFAQMTVSCGDSVGEGSTLGTLAAHGDRSSSATHLHMGLKKGGMYYDPMSLFGIGSPDPVPAGQESYATNAAAMQASPSIAYDTFATEGISLENLALENVNIPAAQPALQPGTISSGNAVWQPKEETHQPNIFEHIGQACVDQLKDIQAEIEYIANETGIPVTLAYTLAVVAVLAVLTLASILFARFCFPSIRRASHRAVSYLSEAWGGGIILKLFPAWGTTFISLSQQDRRR